MNPFTTTFDVKSGDALPKSADGKPCRIELYGFLPIEGWADVSPACLKLATYLKMCKVDYKYLPAGAHNCKHSNRAKMPYVRTNIISTAGNDGDKDGLTTIMDSNIIMHKLQTADPKTFVLDGHLTPQEAAIATAFRVMFEESFYWTCIVATRWNDKEQYNKTTKPTYFSDALPRFMWFFFDMIVRPKILRDSKGQGTGLMTDDEILLRAQKELDAMSTQLGTNAYFMGDRFCSLDATAFGYLGAAIQGDWEHPIKDEVLKRDNLVKYVERMSKEFWPELASKLEQEQGKKEDLQKEDSQKPDTAK